MTDQASAIVRLFAGMADTRRTTIAFELAGSAGGAWADGDGDLAMAMNVISERVLKMPRDATPYRDLPFRDVPAIALRRVILLAVLHERNFRRVSANGSADNTPPPTLPVPQAGKKGDPPKMKQCVYGPVCYQPGEGLCGDFWTLPANICAPGQIATYLATKFPGPPGNPLHTCFSAILNYYCDPAVSPPAKIQSRLNIPRVIARSVDENRIKNIMNQCFDAFNDPGVIPNQQVADQIGSLITNAFHYALCDDDWDVQGKDIF